MIEIKNSEFTLEDLQAEIEAIKAKDDAVTAIVKTLQEGLDKISEVEKGKKYYDKSLGESIKSALNEAISKLGAQKQIDLTPIVSLVQELSAQNKKVMEVLMNQPKPETLAPLFMEMIKKQNELLAVALNKQPADIKGWVFDIERNGMNDTIVRVKGKPEYGI